MPTPGKPLSSVKDATAITSPDRATRNPNDAAIPHGVFRSLGSSVASSSQVQADAEDEDDGLVVMLKARIENLQGQLARFTNS